jgi:hypothetical protein
MTSCGSPFPQRSLGQFRFELERSINTMLTCAEADYRVLSKDELEALATMQRALAAIATVASELQISLPNKEEHDLEDASETAERDGKDPAPQTPRGNMKKGWSTIAVTSTVNVVSDVVDPGGESDEDFDDEEEESSSSEEEGDRVVVGGGSGTNGKVGSEGGIGTGLLATCEIAWQGKIERTVFPLPIEYKYLTKKTKSDFMKEVTTLR